MPRPYWSGQLQISLVSFGIKLYPATEAASEIRFHQLSRKTGERVHHQKVSGSSGEEGPVQKDEIVKGYEYRKGQYVMIEPQDIANLRIPSRQTLEVTQFVDLEELDPKFFEKPYFVTPENASQAEAFAVVRKALQTTKKAALGKIAFGGREHLVAVSAPKDDEQLGMMAYMMRYGEELRDPAPYFGDIKKVEIDEDQLALAKELIKRKASSFDPKKFKDEYEAALRTMVEAKVNHAPVEQEAPAARSPKVVNLMDALRRSVQEDGGAKEAAATKKKPAAKAVAESAEEKKGLTLVKSEEKAKAGKAAHKRKSA